MIKIHYHTITMDLNHYDYGVVEPGVFVPFPVPEPDAVLSIFPVLLFMTVSFIEVSAIVVSIAIVSVAALSVELLFFSELHPAYTIPVNAKTAKNLNFILFVFKLNKPFNPG